MLSRLLLFSGLLNLNGPLRDRPLLANAEENEDYDEEEDDDDTSEEEQEKPPVEEGAVMVHSSSSIEEHFLEQLPPFLHKGNML